MSLTGAERSRRWRERHPETSRSYRARHLDQVREYERRYYAEHKDEWKERQKRRRPQVRAVRDALKSGPCTDCGGTFPPECMDWDHLPGQPKVNHTNRLEGAALLAEIAKCELVCANCHRIRSKKRMTA